MSIQSARVVVLVKALPQPSTKYGETVCCAGVTADRQWKRLFPIRFRHLSGESSFKRWDWISFRFGRPAHDQRAESCHVHEESIKVDGQLALRDRARLIEPMLLESCEQAAAQGSSLAFIRPRNSRFRYRPKSPTEVQEEREAYRSAAAQTSFLDRKLAELDPSPFEFWFEFEDGAGRHSYHCGDWEAHAMFWNGRLRMSEIETLRWMDQTFNEDYPRRGMVFAIGNVARRPHTWQLLGVIRVEELNQSELPL